MPQKLVIVTELKRALKERGLTYIDVARQLKLSHASVKRIFAAGDLSLERIDGVCALLGLEFVELIGQMRERQVPMTRLTLAQEREIAADPRLFLMTWLVINRWRLSQILEAFRFTEREVERYLIKLDRLRIIELQPGNRPRLKVTHNVVWNPRGPLQKLINQRLLKEFLADDFTGPEAEFRFYGSSMSESAIAQIKRAIQGVLKECTELAERDANLPLAERRGAAYLFALRNWQYSGFDELRRRDGSGGGR